MVEDYVNYGDTVGYYALLTVIMVLAWWEGKAPRRSLDKPIRLRWARNFGLFIVSTLVARLAVPLVGVEVARQGLINDFGLFHFLSLPLWLNILCGVLVLDLLRYGQHWISHRYAILWRAHRLHHTDEEFDYTTSLRFHPLELCWITLVNAAVISALGLHPLTVALAGVLSFSINTWNHANLFIPPGLEKTLRLFIVTPDMHRVHHSALPREFNTNLGGLFPWWDRLFGTYIDQPSRGHQGMAIGLRGYHEEQTSFLGLLLDPFVPAISANRQSAPVLTDSPDTAPRQP